MAKIDVIIPLYNGEDFILDTIKSVENNTFKDFNIIVVDDGSKDNSSKIVRNLAKNYENILYFYKENSGVSSARNYGIERSNSKYLCFLDADDLHNPLFLEKLYEKISLKDSDLCLCGYNQLIDEKIYPKKTRFIKNDFLTNYLITKNKFHISCFMIKRDIILANKIKFFENTSYGEDIEFLSKVIKHSKNIELVKEYLTYYRIDPERDSLSSFNLKKIEDDVAYSFRLFDDKKLNLNDREKKALINHKLVGSIVNKLLKAIELGYDLDILRQIYNNYEPIIVDRTNIFGLRSLKLYLNTVKLQKKLGYDKI